MQVEVGPVQVHRRITCRIHRIYRICTISKQVQFKIPLALLLLALLLLVELLVEEEGVATLTIVIAIIVIAIIAITMAVAAYSPPVSTGSKT